MIDVSCAKKNFSKEEQYAIKWLNEHNFDGRVEKQYVSKSIFTISKDGVTDKFELSAGISAGDMARYMKQFEQNWNTLCELQKLRAKVNS